MKAKTVRIIIRWIHIAGGLAVMCYVYSPFHELKAFQYAMKFGIIPIVVLTGVWAWKFAKFNKIFKINQ